MVLKVVRGKILETLGLRSLPASCGSVLEPQAGMALAESGAGCQGDAPAVRLSKIKYYLVDNIYVFILSLSMSRVQEESGRMAERFPNWDDGQGGLYSVAYWGAWMVQLRKNPAQAELGRGTLAS